MENTATPKPDLRIAALRRFSIAITVLTVLGHTLLGFEQSVAQVFVALATTYSMALLLEFIEARQHGRRPRYAGGYVALIDFLLPAHIPALAIAMLLYANDQLLPFAVAAAVAMTTKVLFRAPVGRGTRHFFNPSNSGIAAVLLLFAWVGIAPPYQFTENISGVWDWVLPGVIVCTGAFLNARFTKRIPLILAWVGVFALQAVLRSVIFDTPLTAGLLPMTGLAFLLFTFYMVSDPATTPSAPRAQVVFGGAVAAVYGLLVMFHVVFGMFFALAIVCALHGIYLYWVAAQARRSATLEVAVAPLQEAPP